MGEDGWPEAMPASPGPDAIDPDIKIGGSGSGPSFQVGMPASEWGSVVADGLNRMVDSVQAGAEAGGEVRDAYQGVADVAAAPLSEFAGPGASAFLSEALTEPREPVGNATDARDFASDVVDRAGEVANDAMDTAGDFANHAMGTAGDFANDVVDWAGEAIEGADNLVGAVADACASGVDQAVNWSMDQVSGANTEDVGAADRDLEKPVSADKESDGEGADGEGSADVGGAEAETNAADPSADGHGEESDHGDVTGSEQGGG